MLVKNWMTSNPLTLAPEESVRSALRLLRRHRFQQFPVIKDGKLVGMITARDFRGASKRLKTVAEAMINDPRLMILPLFQKIQHWKRPLE